MGVAITDNLETTASGQTCQQYVAFVYGRPKNNQRVSSIRNLLLKRY